MIEKEEKEYLAKVYAVLQDVLASLNKAITEGQTGMKELSEFMSEHFYEMDAQEAAVQRNLLEKLQLDLLGFIDMERQYKKQAESAYFGRIDFQAEFDDAPRSYYIGIKNLIRDASEYPLVVDWRAPLSSLYYDYELGKCAFTAPMGEITGEITKKRQYKVRGDKLEYAFDSSLTIGDEILREVLAGNADEKMKTIVATIQAEQNKIIRENAQKNLIVQGIAGSGKTSIALHRVAYLLYNNHYAAKDVIIITPTEFFSTYISDVLPELGEHDTPKITLEEIAKIELESVITGLTRSSMLEDILQGNTERAQHVEYKATFEFMESLKTYLADFDKIIFSARDIAVGKKVFSAAEIDRLYHQRYKGKTPAVKISWIADWIVEQLDTPQQNEKSVFERTKKVLYTMLDNVTILDVYKAFLLMIGLPADSMGYEDVPALLYIKNYLMGLEVHKEFKHVIIDEMQDYSPLAFEVFDIIYPAKKTILGDIYQAVEKRLDHEYLAKLAKQIGNCKLIKLAKTYRSTREINEYSQALIGLENAVNFNRTGAPVVCHEKTRNFISQLHSVIAELEKSAQSIAVITATIEDSELLYKILYRQRQDFGLIGQSVGSSSAKVNIIPAVFAKGLEFDAVVFVDSNKPIVPQFIHRNIKYVSCTRALHNLIVFS